MFFQKEKQKLMKQKKMSRKLLHWRKIYQWLRKTIFNKLFVSYTG